MEEATGDICIYCDQDTVPVGFWSASGEWVGPFKMNRYATSVTSTTAQARSLTVRTTAIR